jgi:hypothetical protein
MWIGTKDKWYCHDKLESALWLAMDVTGSFHDQSEVLFGLKQMIEYNLFT